jgi:hypothetical protein
MPLQGAIKSRQAHALVAVVTEAVLEPINGRAKRIGPSMRSKYRTALGAFLADLMGAAKQGRWGRRSVHTTALSGCPGGRVAFDDMRTALVHGGMVEEIRGCKRPPREDGYEMENTCASTIFRPTPVLMSLVQEFGIDLDQYRQHFTPSGARPWVPGDVLEARAAKRSKGGKALCLPIDPADPKARECRERMERLNAFLIDGGRVSGILFGGLRRIFSDADQPGFAWQWGGRFYSMPNWEAYEQLKGKAVKRREAIQIDGQRVAEVDISAAHLTIYHGLLGQPLDAALYAYDLGGFEVPLVKEWTKKALGAGKATWGGPRYGPVRAAMLKRYPLLKGLGSGNGITTLAMQFHESEIILSALEDLRDHHDIAALPIHDGLIVPEVHQVLAQGVLSDAFQRYFRDTIRAERIPTPRVGLVPYKSL